MNTIKLKLLFSSLTLFFSVFSFAQIISTFPYEESFETGGPDNTTELPADWTIVTNGTDSPLNTGFVMNSIPDTGSRGVNVVGVPSVSLEAWMITPEIQFVKGETYIIKISFRTEDEGGAAAGIAIGDTLDTEDIGQLYLWDLSSVDNRVYNDVEIEYTFLENNTKYIGVVVTSVGGRNTQNIFDSFSINRKTLSNQKFEKDFVSIIPNPVKDVFKLELKELTNNLSLTIYNSLGKLVISQENLQLNNLIEVSHLPNGVFFAKIKDATGRFLFKKIIKQ